MKERLKKIGFLFLLFVVSVAFTAFVIIIIESLVETNTTAGALAFTLLVLVLTEIFYKFL